MLIRYFAFRPLLPCNRSVTVPSCCWPIAASSIHVTKPPKPSSKLVDGQRSLGDIIDLALDRYETSRTTLEEDFTAIALELVQEGILQA